MRLGLAAICLTLALSACQSTVPAGGLATSGLSGASQEQAIVLGDEYSEMTGVAAEYHWIKTNRPGWVFVRQTLVEDKERYYDIMTIKKNGQTQDIWFDITGFFGRML